MNKITHAVIPAAGLGTRFLPFTKTIPKELVPLLNRPAIEYIVQEIQTAGINNICIIANKDKQALHDYFKQNDTLETHLARKEQLYLLQESNDLLRKVNVQFTSQPEPKGLGHAILGTESIIGKNPFCVLLPDDLMINQDGESLLQEMINYAQQHNAMILAVEEMPIERVSAYGIVEMTTKHADNLFTIKSIVEKPKVHEAPSRYAAIGRYVLFPPIFEALRHTKPGAGGEIQLTDAIATCLKNGFPIMAYICRARHFDLGNPHGWLQANIFLASQDPSYRNDLAIIDK
jgi:UTP--glucose-1-phosphate uridylyltransferase